MARVAVLGLVAAVLCAGCGSVEGETTTRAAAVEPAATVPFQPPGRDRRGSWSVEMFFATGEAGNEEEGAPLAETLGVMSEPRTPADQLPGWADGMLDGVADAPNYHPGTPLEGRSRRVIAPSGDEGYAIYAMPTTNGWVCTVGYQRPNGGGSGACQHGLYRGVSIDIGGDGDTAHVAGLRADDVNAVDVVIDGEPHPARLGPNAFSLELAMAELCRGSGLEHLLIHRAGGATETFPLRAPSSHPGAGACG